MISRVLIANRGEVAIRIARACAELGIGTVAVYPEDDRTSLHVAKADRALLLPGAGAAAYLDGDALVATAREAGCAAVHPGYGFLSENADFARRCAEAGLLFIGPSPEALELFGDKGKARALAIASEVPVAAGTEGATSLEEARAFLARLPPGRGLMVKALAGGGGRGMRIVQDASALEDAWKRCASEARASFGADALYVEELIGRARHVEVQIAGDRTGRVTHLFERECSVQRRHQKIVEIAPSPWLEQDIRDDLAAAAVRLAQKASYVGVGTVEFLVEVDEAGCATGRSVFMEMNPRLQVEHTVTEEVTGIDLVKTQIALADGSTLDDLGLALGAIAPRGHAIQLRINMETLAADGTAWPASGRLDAFVPPSGAGVRIETAGYPGYETHSGFDALLAKLVVNTTSPAFSDTIARAYRALCEFQIEGVPTNIGVLQNLLRHPDFIAGRADTRFVERHAAELAASGPGLHPSFHAETRPQAAEPELVGGMAGDPDEPEGATAIRAPMRGKLAGIEVGAGDIVRAGQTLAVVEAMKMEHAVLAETAGTVLSIAAPVGEPVLAGAPILYLRPLDGVFDIEDEGEASGSAAEPPELTSLLAHKAAIEDAARPHAVARQRKREALTARERLALLCDENSFFEIGGLVKAHGIDREAPADGVVVGTAKIAGRPAAVVSQDFSVFGGSAGHLGSEKVDRAVAISLAQGIPLVMLLDGGGHRIQDGQNSRSYAQGAATFHDLARLSGWVPVVTALLGAGFAANTNYSGMADFVVMVRGRATMGLAGPALVKAGTGETISAQALGGAAAQVDSYGLADLGVDSEEEAIKALKRFLSFLPANARAEPMLAPAPSSVDEAARAEALLGIVPANTRKSYDVRRVISLIADPDSTFEVKPTFARNIVTSFGRIDGKPVGFIANQALFLGGMLDSPACEKGAHFVAMCDAFGLPLIYLIDVPGFAIGSDAEKTTLGRRSAKLIYELGHATVPRVSVVLRKGYGLGYVAMAGGRSFDADASLAWPTAEICAMSVEGSVDVAYRQIYESSGDPAAKRQELIDSIRSLIGPLQAAEGFGIDDVIDPRTTRARLMEVLARTPARRPNHLPAKYRSIAPI